MDIKARIAELEKETAEHQKTIAQFRQLLQNHTNAYIAKSGALEELRKLDGDNNKGKQ